MTRRNDPTSASGRVVRPPRQPLFEHITEELDGERLDPFREYFDDIDDVTPGPAALPRRNTQPATPAARNAAARSAASAEPQRPASTAARPQTGEAHRPGAVAPAQATEPRRPGAAPARRQVTAAPREPTEARAGLAARYIVRPSVSVEDELERVMEESGPLYARPYGMRSVRRFGTNALPGRPGTLMLVAVFSLIVILTLGRGNTMVHPSAWGLWPGDPSAEVAPAALRPPGDYMLRGAPSLTVQQIDQILDSYNSPARGTGALWYELGRQYSIDPAFAIAFFIHESSAGSNPNWAGLKPDGTTTHNVGNIICAGYPRCYGRFRDYGSWQEGINDWYRLIDVEYINGRGTQTVAEIIPIYAPAVENDVQGYVNAVHQMVDRWRAGQVP